MLTNERLQVTRDEDGLCRVSSSTGSSDLEAMPKADSVTHQSWIQEIDRACWMSTDVVLVMAEADCKRVERQPRASLNAPTSN